MNTLCRRGTHWKTLADPKFISLTTIQFGKKIKDKKERVFGSASYELTNITSGEHKQKSETTTSSSDDNNMARFASLEDSELCYMYVMVYIWNVCYIYMIFSLNGDLDLFA